MLSIFPKNSYAGTCSCGAAFIAPKGTLHCHSCLYERITELEKDMAYYKCCALSGEVPEELCKPSSIDLQEKALKKQAN